MKKQLYVGLLGLLAVSSVMGAEANAIAPEAVTLPLIEGAKVVSKTPLVARAGNVSRFAGYRVTYQFEGKPYTVLILDEKSIKSMEQLKKQKTTDNNRT